MHRDDLVRLGSKHDGGYIVTKNIIEHTDFLVSLGIGADWTFEADFYKRKGIPVHCYDHTIGLGRFTRYAIRDMRRLLLSPHAGDAGAAYATNILLPLQYRIFFYGKRKHFVEKIGDDPEHYTDFRKMFSRIPARDRVFLKMDIEGYEYRAIHGIKDYYERLTGITVEFHHLATMMDTVRRHVGDLGEHFHIVHVHVNNFNGTDERGIPATIEMTFESKELTPGKEMPSERSYPVDGLDSPNAAHERDYRLEFSG